MKKMNRIIKVCELCNHHDNWDATPHNSSDWDSNRKDYNIYRCMVGDFGGYYIESYLFSPLPKECPYKLEHVVLQECNEQDD